MFLLTFTAAAMMLSELGDENTSSAIKRAVRVVVENAVHHRHSILSSKTTNQEHTNAFLAAASLTGHMTAS